MAIMLFFSLTITVDLRVFTFQQLFGQFLLT